MSQCRLFPHAVPGPSANQKDPPQHYTVQVFRYAVPEPSATQNDLAQHHSSGWSLAHRGVHANNAKVIWMDSHTHTQACVTFTSSHRRTRRYWMSHWTKDPKHKRLPRAITPKSHCLSLFAFKLSALTALCLQNELFIHIGANMSSMTSGAITKRTVEPGRA